MSTCPVDIEVLMHYYTVGGKHPSEGTDAVKRAIDKFLHDGILERNTPPNDPSSLEITLKGELWVKLILKTPYPRKAWIDQNDEILAIDGIK